MEKLKDFLEKWQWASLEEADKTLTDSEQKIWELMKKNQKLERQLEEKNKRIKKLNLEAQKYYEDAYCNDFQYKAKIDFAIEQLEEVMQFCKKRRTPDGNNVLTINVDEELLLEDNLMVFIERKIKELGG